MTRRRFLLFASLITAIGLSVGIWLSSPRSAITLANATRIEEGMPLSEVETILGGPARDESSGPVEPEDPWTDALVVRRPWTRRNMYGNRTA
jgi:hypothetical protein